MKIVTSAQMRLLEQTAPGDLMEQAGTRCAREIDLILKTFPAHHRNRLVVCCGPGNNGGDGFVIAREFQKRADIQTIVVYTRPVSELIGDAARHAQSVHWQVKMIAAEDFQGFRSGDVIIDAVLGIGVSGEVRGICRDLIDCINTSRCPVIAIDIPSGVNADTGEASCAVEADWTLTIGRPKIGVVQSPCAGTVKVIDLDGLDENISADCPEGFADQDARMLLNRLPCDAHKNSRGRLLVVAGSSLYPGAPQLTTHAAFRAGCSMVRLCVPPGTFYSHLPLAAITCRVPGSENGFFDTSSFEAIRELAKQSDALAMGSGMGQQQGMTELCEKILTLPQPLIFDADALNMMAKSPELWATRPPESMVLTPHKGELKRLCDSLEIGLDAQTLAHVTEQIVVDKGPKTAIYGPNGSISINLSGNPALATAGSGDVLTGVIAGFLSSGHAPFEAAQLGVFVHGRAADIWRGAKRSLMADDLIPLIGEALHDMAPIA